MTINCPHGWRHVARAGPVTLENRQVTIHGGVCDSPDLCGIRTCEFFDDSRAGSARYNQGLLFSYTAEDLWTEDEAKEEFERRRAAGDTFTRSAPFQPINLVRIEAKHRPS